MDFQSLDMILQQFENLFTGGMGTILGHTMGLLQILALLDIGLALVLQFSGVGMQMLLNRMFKIGFWVFVVSEYDTLINAIIDTFSALGLAAGGSGTIGVNILKNPSMLLEMAMKLTDDYMAFAKETNTGMYAFFSNLDILIPAYLGTWIIILAFGIIILQIFITFVEFYVFALLALFFLAFAVFSKTSFISEKVIGGVISYGVKLMVLSCILSAIGPIINSLSFTVEGTPDFDHIVGACAGCLSLAFITWQAPAVAAGLMAGSPSLSAGTVASNAMAGAAGTVAGGMAGWKAIGSPLTSAAGWTASKAPGTFGAMIGGAQGVDQFTTPAAGALRGAFSHMKNGAIGEGTAIRGAYENISGKYSRGFATGSAASAAHQGTSWNGSNTSSGGSAAAGGAANTTATSGAGGDSTVHGDNFTMIDPSSAGGRAESSSSASSGSSENSFASETIRGENFTISGSSNSSSSRSNQNTGAAQPKQHTGTFSKMAILSQAERAIPPEAHPSAGMGFQIKDKD